MQGETVKKECCLYVLPASYPDKSCTFYQTTAAIYLCTIQLSWRWCFSDFLKTEHPLLCLYRL
jgi:hypothetical protein